MLKQLGCSSDHAIHGEQALEQLMFSEPGLHTLVLMDLRMSVMDGAPPAASRLQPRAAEAAAPRVQTAILHVQTSALTLTQASTRPLTLPLTPTQASTRPLALPLTPNPGFNATKAIKKMGIDVPVIAVTADGRSSPLRP